MTGTRPVVVVGDSLLDIDLVGRARRLAPDAPVPVVEDPAERRRPGGAGLAASLVAAAGRETVLVTALADDDEAAQLRSMLEGRGVHVVAVPHDGRTVVKRRVLAGDQVVTRLDSGHGGAISVAVGALAAVAEAEVVLVSDYGHGLTSHPGVRRALTERARGTPVVWDPHPRGAEPVRGSVLVTPSEAEAVALVEPARFAASTRLAAADRAARRLVRRWSSFGVAVTLGADGAMLSIGDTSPYLFPAAPVEGRDSCGAGDQFSAAAAAALATGALLPEAVEQAVASASAYVARGGAVALDDVRADDSRSDPVRRVRERGGTVVATGGCFDLLHAGHVATLEAARALGDCLVVCLNSDASVRRLKGAGRPVVPELDRVRVLRAMACVDDVVLFDEDTPSRALSELRPHVWAKGGDYAGVDLPEAGLLRSWGGQAVVLPYLDGRSTTRLVAVAAGA